MNWDSLPCGIYAMDERDRITLWNTAMEELTGIGREKILRREADQVHFFTAEASENPHNPFQRVREQNGSSCSQALYLRDRENKLRLVFAQATRLHGLPSEDGDILVVVSDISEQISCDLLDPLLKPASFHGMVGQDRRMVELYRLVGLASESMANVLITGESGTGKELVARAVHSGSARKNRPIVTVSCSALPETLLESELFGHVKGAFTGAYRDKIGRFEAANGGTIFLDEIGDISPAIQLKLLRVIQEKVIERVGDSRLIEVDMRIISATNRDLRKLVEQGIFREDLFYRLRVFPIHVSPLRERKQDIPSLCEHFIGHFNKKTGKHLKGLTDNAARLLIDYCWPGNVRELENTIEYAFVVSGGELIDVFDLPQEIRVIPMKEEICGKKDTELIGLKKPVWQNISREELVELLESNRGNKAETARQLDVSRVTLWKKIKSLSLES